MFMTVEAKKLIIKNNQKFTTKNLYCHVKNVMTQPQKVICDQIFKTKVNI